eukprot:gene5428-6581_t
MRLILNLLQALPKDDSTGDYSRSFSSSEEIYDWLEDLISTVWTDPECGDSACEPPYEYAGFGLLVEDNGCSADCGLNPFISEVTLTVTATARIDENSAAEAALRADFLDRTQWNLCTLRSGLETGTYDLTGLTMQQFTKDQDTGLYDIPDGVLCWWNEWQQFTAPTVSTDLRLLRAEWKVLLDAPIGGVSIKVDNTTNGDTIISQDYCMPLCSWQQPCGEGHYCHYTTASTVGHCLPCKEDDISCRAAAKSPTGQQLVHPWEVVSYYYYCEPYMDDSFGPYFGVETIDECKARPFAPFASRS